MMQRRSSARFAPARPGHLVLLLLLGAGLFSAGCRSLQVDRPSGVSEADWLTEGDSPRRQYDVQYAIQPPLEQVWAYNAGAGFGPGSPLLFGNAVLVGTRKGEVHGIDLETGRRLGINGFGDAVEGTPVIHDGVLFVPVAWGRRALYAYDLVRGSTRWSRKQAPIETGLLVLNNTLFAVDAESILRAYRPRDGEVLWKHAFDSTAGVYASPIAVGTDRVVVADDRGRVTALRAQDGTVDWRVDLGSPLYATPATDGERIYLPTSRGRFNVLQAANGGKGWEFAIPDTTVYFTTPAVSERDVVFGGSDGVLRMLDAATGALKWTFEVDEAFAAAPLLTESVVYVGGLGEKLYAVDRASGAELAAYKLDGRIKSALAARDGSLIVASEPRTVYLFRPTSSEYAATE